MFAPWVACQQPCDLVPPRLRRPQQQLRCHKGQRPAAAASAAALLLATCVACCVAALAGRAPAFVIPSAVWRYAAARGALPSAGAPRRPSRRRTARGDGTEGFGEDEGDQEEGDWAARMLVQDLEVGQELNGIVNSVAPFGCFVDVGAERDGLVHISRISEGFVDDIESIVQPGQAVKVWVLGVSPQGKLSLTMVKSKGTDDSGSADLTGFQDLSPEEWLEGTVAAVTDFGLFVAVSAPGGGPVAQGLVHISQIRDGFVEHPAEEAEVGQSVQVRVLQADPGSGKLKLSMKQPAERQIMSPDSQDVSAFQGTSPAQWIKGRVHHTVPFGIFVDVEPPAGGQPVQGMVHITEIRDGFVDDPSEEADIGQEVSVRVLNVDAAAGRLSLSMKAAEADTAAVDA